MGLIIRLDDPEILEENRRERERVMNARPRICWVYGCGNGSYHAYVNPQVGLEAVSFCGYATTTNGIETKTPGAPRCEDCVHELTC